ncbi:MAG: hypothetical protein KIT09_33660, partial [Bryobacteraceae bacterium]|nr:hypothetical protein [Bryobacteraceae bacterium]
MEPDELVVDVTRSSQKELHPHGKTSILSASVHTIEVRERHAKWQAIGTAIGAAPSALAPGTKVDGTRFAAAVKADA